MIGRKGKILNLLILVFFLSTISFANFFHTEKTPFDNENCPACQLLKSTQATGEIHFFHLAEPALLEILPVIESPHYAYILVLHPSSRSPPQVG